MAYATEKRVFLRQYAERFRDATTEQASEAWKARYLAHQATDLGEPLERAEAEYHAREGHTFTPNPRRSALPGGVPFETVLEVTVYARPSGGVVVGALLENKAGARFFEVTGSAMPKLYRVAPGSATTSEIFYRTGRRRSLPPGFSELDALVRVVSDDPEAFSELIEKDPKAEWMEVHPEAAVLARWGSRGERARAHL